MGPSDDGCGVYCVCKDISRIENARIVGELKQ